MARMNAITVTSERDLDKLLETHPTIAALPQNREELNDLSKLAPTDKRFVYIMKDSGASLHAGSLKKHFPRHLLRISEGQRRGDYALTANGRKLFNNSEFTVKGTCDGVNMSLNFTDMDVDLPVSSVRQFVKSGYEVTFNE